MSGPLYVECSYYGRMKFTRWRPSCVLLLLLVSVFPALAEKVSTMPQPTGYIDDYAGVISSPAKSEMEALCNELHTKTKAQVFLVTINTLEGEAVETFANELFAKWKIGEKKTDRGILLLFAIKDRKRWIEVGYGLEGILNDAKVGDIGREMVPALKAADYDEAIKIGLQEVSKVIATDSGVTLDGLSAPSEEQNQSVPPAPQPAPSSEHLYLARFLIAFMFGPLILFIALFIWRIKHGMRMGSGMSSSGSDGGSSFGSSDSSFGSSSDDSFGGGDGGSSGGGGAGGDW
jgi:uncharacterized protein